MDDKKSHTKDKSAEDTEGGRHRLTWGDLKGRTWGELKEFTWGELEEMTVADLSSFTAEELSHFTLEELSTLSFMEVAEKVKGLRGASGQARQGTVKPRTQIDPNSKLANSITKVGFGETVGLDVSGKRERKGSVQTFVTLEYDGGGVELTKPMTQYDREIHNAVTTLWKAGNQSFTTRQVWKVLSGSDSKPKREQLEAIEQSIDKQRRTIARVDFSAEARGRELTIDGERVESYIIESYLLAARKEKIETANGRTIEGYTLIEMPVLYRHAAALKQVITYPIRLLDTAEAGQNTGENIVIKKYLLRRIHMAKGKSKTSPRIKYSSVYEKAGIPDPTPKQRKRMNDFTIACLKLWQGEGLIKGYREYKEGKARAGVDVAF